MPWDLKQILTIVAVAAALSAGWYFGFLPLPA